MDNMRFMIAQGSTPRIELLLPFELKNRYVVFVTFEQKRNAVLEYGLGFQPSPEIAGEGTLSVDPDDKSMLVLNMTQQDTLSLIPCDIEMQVRVKTDDGADTFLPIPGHVIKAIKGGVIDWRA